ncbi:MAG: polymer-forming cytoskeletal protein [Spirochaetes bacterium]|nr:polymer-forming cytoskeletal protein [Spirochaetota bacterium]
MAKEIMDREAEEEKNIKTILSEDIEYSGNLKFSTSLKIKGKFKGEIDATGHLFIGSKADVKANIKAKTITIYGRITGNIEAFDKVELLSHAQLSGDVKTPDIIIQSGCVFNGNCIMTKRENHKPSGHSETKPVKADPKEEKKN